MTAKHEAKRREDRRMTAATERVTGHFYCSSSAHMATGTPVIIRGRKVCRGCADQRRRILKEKARG